MDKYYPDGDKTDLGNVTGYCFGYTVIQVLKTVRRCADARQRHEAGGEPERFRRADDPLPGIKLNTSADDFAPIKQVQMAKFDGARLAIVRQELLAGSVTHTLIPRRGLWLDAAAAVVSRSPPRKAAGVSRCGTSVVKLRTHCKAL